MPPTPIPSRAAFYWGLLILMQALVLACLFWLGQHAVDAATDAIMQRLPVGGGDREGVRDLLLAQHHFVFSVATSVIVTAGVIMMLHFSRRRRLVNRLYDELAALNRQLEVGVEARTDELTTILDASPALIWYKDANNIILRANKPAAASVGLSSEAIVGKSTYELYPQHAEKYHQDDLEVIRSGKPKLNIIEPYNDLSNEIRWVRTDKIPYRDAKGQIIGVMVFALDITDRIHAQEELRRLAADERAARLEAERLGRVKDEFLVTLSHELRTPLVPIIGWLDVLKSAPLTLDAVAGALPIIERSAKAELRLIEDLLDTSRIISGKLVLEREAVDLQHLVKAAAETLELAAEAKRHQVKITLATGHDVVQRVVHGDSRRLQQVIWNLLGNAIKFTPEGGHIQLELSFDSARAEIKVSDDGIGIAPEFLPHVFERFRQADSSTTRVYGGLGLGLSLVQHLTEAHGGRVGVESAGLGRGATFTVTLPLVAPTH